MDKAAQMEAARILAQEFKSEGNSRRAGGARGGARDGMRGGGGAYSVGAGRSLNTPRSEFARNPMTRPMPANPRMALSAGNANKNPTRINPSLAGWLGGQSTYENNPAKSVSAATKEAIVPIPVDPNLASWLTNSKQSQPLSVKPVPNVNAALESDTSASEATAAAVQPTAVYQAQTILEEPMRATAQTQGPASISTNKDDRDKPVTDGASKKKATLASKGNGLGNSIWASENQETVRTQDESSGQRPVVDSSMSNRASDIPQEQKPAFSTATAYDGQVARLLETDHTKDKTQKTANKTGSNLQLRQQPAFGTLLWALQQLEAGLELPDPQQVKAYGNRLNDNRSNTQSVATSQSDDVKGAISHGRDQKTENGDNGNVSIEEIACTCPKRSHPVVGLAASKYNTDADGDVDISGMSTAARNKFAVNVILQDHSKPDCPVLLRTKTKYPLYFGASPAMVNDEEDGLNVTVWEETRQEIPSVERPKQRSDGARGLTSSIWAV
ncbi:hypothetical protein LX36DRAFT_737209 [Colletotrichum falcatum]|nr:hypothetical protein LX36DRAFT_737209 [Colletotrichum falcatum]